MRFGISSPVVNLAGKRPAWERQAGTAELVQIAQTADRLGFDYLTCSDHVAVPPGLPRGERFYDPLATFAYLAALTARIRFLPYVLVLPFYHPLELAKRYGTLDHLSGGRLILGLGVGNLREEFDMLGVEFDDRGPRADDSLRALRAALSNRVVSYAGPYYQFDNLVLEPHAVQSHVPMWIGGHTGRSLRRAVSLADGWCPSPVQFSGPDPETLRSMLARVDLPAGFDLITTAEQAFDPMGSPARAREVVGVYQGLGARLLIVAGDHDSLSHYLEQLAAFAELAQLS
jgi:probable F420-dependent oxidoreductase